MRIGLVALPLIPIPPLAYGGIERMVAVQAAVLAEAGHDVTRPAARGSAFEGVRVIEPSTSGAVRWSRTSVTASTDGAISPDRYELAAIN